MTTSSCCSDTIGLCQCDAWLSMWALGRFMEYLEDLTPIGFGPADSVMNQLVT